MKQDERQGCLKTSYLLGPALRPLSGEVGWSEEGPKEIKYQTRTILETINTLKSISYNHLCDTRLLQKHFCRSFVKVPEIARE